MVARFSTAGQGERGLWVRGSRERQNITKRLQNINGDSKSLKLSSVHIRGLLSRNAWWGSAARFLNPLRYFRPNCAIHFRPDLTIETPFQSTLADARVLYVNSANQVGSNRPFSYSRYWTGISLQWRLMWGNIIKKRVYVICIWKDSPY